MRSIPIEATEEKLQKTRQKYLSTEVKGKRLKYSEYDYNLSQNPVIGILSAMSGQPELLDCLERLNTKQILTQGSDKLLCTAIDCSRRGHHE
jgi:hypothetical protein